MEFHESKHYKTLQSTPVIYIIDNDLQSLQQIAQLVSTVNYSCAPYQNSEQFLQEINPQQMGCIVTEARMANYGGLQLQKALQERHISLPIIFVSAIADVSTAVKAMKGGAIDFFCKPFNEQELLDSINRGLKLAQSHHQKQRQQSAVNARLALLSEREQEVLQLIAHGISTKKIADNLHIADKTVEAHRSNIMRKLHSDSLADLIKVYLQSQ